MLTVNLIKELTDNFNFVGTSKLRNVIDNVLQDYDICKQSNALMISDLDEKIKYYLASKAVDGVSEQTIKNYELQLKLFAKFLTSFSKNSPNLYRWEMNC